MARKKQPKAQSSSSSSSSSSFFLWLLLPVLISIVAGVYYSQFLNAGYLSLPSIEWQSSSHLKHQKVPALLQNCPTKRWFTASKSSSELIQYFINHLKAPSYQVKTRSPANFVHYDESLALAKTFGPGYSIHSMNFISLLDKLNGSTTVGYYLNDEAIDLAPAFAAELDPLEELFVRDIPPKQQQLLPQYDPLGFMTKLWIGGPTGCTANLHYDATHNVFHQLVGRKRFLLIPPSEWHKLVLFSRLHPSHRQSQLDLTQPWTSLVEKYPYLQGLQVYEVVLEPGQTMYLPPFWFHFVQAMDKIVMSVNLWSNCYDANIFQYALMNPLPYVQAFEQQQLIYDSNSHLLNLEIFLKYLVEQTKVKKFDLILVILENHAHTTKTSRKHWTYPCAEEIQGKGLTKVKLKEKMRLIVDKWYDQIFGKMDPSVRPLLLASFIEAIAAQIVQPEYVHPFLQACLLQ